MSDSKTNVVKEVKILSHNIRFLRNHLGISQEELARQIDVKRSNIAAYESKNVEPRLSIILKISKFFDISLQSLLEDKLTSVNFPKVQEIKQNESLNRTIEINNNEEIKEFVKKSMDIRKVLEGFKAFYSFKKDRIKKDNPEQEKLFFDIENFIQLMEHNYEIIV